MTDKDDGTTGTDDLALTVEYLGQDIVIKPNGGGTARWSSAAATA